MIQHFDGLEKSTNRPFTHRLKSFTQYHLLASRPLARGFQKGYQFETVRMTPTIAPQIFRVAKQAYGQYYGGPLNFSILHQSLPSFVRAHRRAWMIGAFSNGELVGVASYKSRWLLGPTRFLSSVSTARVGLLSTTPKHRGHAVGRSLLDFAASLAKWEGATFLALDTAVPSHLPDYYATEGFRIREYLQWPWAHYKSVVMAKDISAVNINWVAIRPQRLRCRIRPHHAQFARGTSNGE